MTHQTIEVPACCPECGEPTCITGIEPGGTANVHCHGKVTGHASGCGWSLDVPIDPDADGYTIIGRGRERPE